MKNKTLTILIIVVVVLLLIGLIAIFRMGRSSSSSPTATTTLISAPTTVPTAIPAPTATPKPAPTEVPTTPSSSDAAIQNITWQWTQLTDQGTVTTVSNPASYTLVFRADETFTGTADCNQISGTYSTRSGFSINVRTTTSAYCGEGSLDQVYIKTLGNVVAGGPDGAGGLALETGGGAQRMQFRNGGMAP